ncbi:hypothetical protein B0E42_25515 [Pseudomonas sp. A25(2017)]|nr:hypothetical protein B0E42_25515 [Pseudomonas sp. A25(2017)]
MKTGLSVGAGLLAKAVNHSTLLSTDSPPSRASPLPQDQYFNWSESGASGRRSAGGLAGSRRSGRFP